VGLLKRTLGGAALIVGVVLAPAVESAYAMPPNDVRNAFAIISNRDGSSVGTYLPATRTATGVDVNPEQLYTVPTAANDVNDPPLLQPLPSNGLQQSSNCPDRGTATGDPTRPELYAQRTVWYEIRQNMNGSFFSQRRLVTIDTTGTNFASSLQVFQDSIPSFNRTATPIRLPSNGVACDSLPAGGGNSRPALVSFIADAGQRYFLEAGIAPSVSVNQVGPALRLQMRILDITPPAVTVRALDVNKDASKVLAYDLSASDGHLTSVVVQQLHRGKPLPKLQLAKPVGSLDCTADLPFLKARSGSYCVGPGNRVFVHWRRIVVSSTDLGRVTASFMDQAKNVGTNAIQTQLRDTIPPQIQGTPRVRWNRKGRLFVSARCIGGPGSIRVEVTSGGTPVRAGKDRFFGRRTMVLRHTYAGVHRRTIFVHIICFDKSKNANDRWLFLPR